MKTIQTKTFGLCELGERIANPTTGEIKYPVIKDGETIMFLSENAVALVATKE